MGSEIPPVSKTAWYTLGIRAEDAQKKPSICNDVYAVDLMNHEAAKVTQAFSTLGRQNAINVVRHRIIDDELRRLLDQNNNKLRIFLLGAGFDTRAYRIKGGSWVEFDDPNVIKYKQERLPTSTCPNNLDRVAIEWGIESLRHKLGKYLSFKPILTDEKVVIVYEGVFMYLPEAQINNVLDDLKVTFSQHILICDLLSKYVFDWYSQRIHKVIKKNCDGAHFKCYSDPWTTMQTSRYQCVKYISCTERASELRTIWLPRFILRGPLFTSLRKGYAVWVWHYDNEN